jgi:uncharacterized protein (TIGR00251 family)
MEMSCISASTYSPMLLFVKAKPNQRFDKVERVGAEWQIRLKAPAVDGKANEHLIEYLSEILKIPKSKINLKKGQTSRIKCLEIIADEKTVLETLEKLANS